MPRRYMQNPKNPDNVLFDIWWQEPPNELNSPLGAAGNAAPPTHRNAPDSENEGVPVINRQGERRWYGRVEKHPGAE